MESEPESFEDKCRRLQASLSQEELEAMSAKQLEGLTRLEQSYNYQKGLLRHLGVRANLENDEEFWLQLWAAGRYLGFSEAEFWQMTPRELCAVIELKLAERDHLCRQYPESGLSVKSESPLSASVPRTARGGKTDRRAEVDAYILEVQQKTGKRITRTDIWKYARYRSRTEFERWERRSPRATRAADGKFRAILSEKPHLR
jgi:hypothetical protein